MAAGLLYILMSVLKQKDTNGLLIKNLGLNLGVLFLCFSVLAAGTVLLKSPIAGTEQEIISLSPGMSAPDFTLEGEDGKLYSLSDYTGRTVVLNFWASWCPPCKAELPELKNFHNALDSDQTIFLSINLYTTEKDPAGLPAFIRHEELPFPVLYDRKGETSNDYGVLSIPTTFIIGPDGKVSAVKKGAVTEAWLKGAVK